MHGEGVAEARGLSLHRAASGLAGRVRRSGSGRAAARLFAINTRCLFATALELSAFLVLFVSNSVYLCGSRPAACAESVHMGIAEVQPQLHAPPGERARVLQSAAMRAVAPQQRLAQRVHLGAQIAKASA